MVLFLIYSLILFLVSFVSFLIISSKIVSSISLFLSIFVFVMLFSSFIAYVSLDGASTKVDLISRKPKPNTPNWWIVVLGTLG